MTANDFSSIAQRLMSNPASPYHEAGVQAAVEAICSEHGLAYGRDKFGNILVRLKTAPRQRPVVLAAHMDHPGFEVIRQLTPNTWEARFLGGVGDAYFKPGVKLRLMPGGVPAKLGKRIGENKEFEIVSAKGKDAPRFVVETGKGAEAKDGFRFAVWELEDFEVADGRITGRACDDLIGVASILATLIELKSKKAKTHVIGVISRAEEVGFHGALTVAAGTLLPKNSLVISLETSRELPPIKMGQGVIVRVGDKASTFDSVATRYLVEVATAQQQKQTGFQFQRALMFGGTCEATAYQEFGFQTTAVCVALGNYHNCAPKDRIGAEFVSETDALGMVDLLVAAAIEMPNFKALVGKLPSRINNLLKEARKRLVA